MALEAHLVLLPSLPALLEPLTISSSPVSFLFSSLPLPPGSSQAPAGARLATPVQAKVTFRVTVGNIRGCNTLYVIRKAMLRTIKRTMKTDFQGCDVWYVVRMLVPKDGGLRC